VSQADRAPDAATIAAITAAITARLRGRFRIVRIGPWTRRHGDAWAARARRIGTSRRGRGQRGWLR